MHVCSFQSVYLEILTTCIWQERERERERENSIKNPGSTRCCAVALRLDSIISVHGIMQAIALIADPCLESNSLTHLSSPAHVAV